MGRLKTMTDEDLCDGVAAVLTAMGFTAESQYTGGGIYCVSILEPTFPNASWLCGMAAECWAGTLMEADSYGIHEDNNLAQDELFIHTRVSSESMRPDRIAPALAREIQRWRAKHPPLRTVLPAAVTGA
jgi:hypothetical protein